MYEREAPDLVRYLRRFVRREEDARDLMQETFARAVGARNAPREVAEMRPWLYRIASNLAIDHLRRARLLAFLPLGALARATSDPVDEAHAVREALRRIPPEQAITLTLALHDGFSRREVAAILGLSEEAVKSRLARGRLSFAAAYREKGR